MQGKETFEKLISDTNVIDRLVQNLESYINKQDTESISAKVAEIVKSKKDQEGMDIIFERVYDFVNENIPDYANKQLQQDIATFINSHSNK